MKNMFTCELCDYLFFEVEAILANNTFRGVKAHLAFFIQFKLGDQ